MAKLNWYIIQKQSDEILLCGLNKLKTQPSAVKEKGLGNYLISLNKVPFYVGEGKELIKRLKQQFKLNNKNGIVRAYDVVFNGDNIVLSHKTDPSVAKNVQIEAETFN